MRKMKNKFTVASVHQDIGACDRRLGQIFYELYQRCIDWGGHPNERGMMGSMKIERAEDRTTLLQLYLHDGDMPMQQALKSAAQVGVTSLHIFQWVFKERFELLGVRTELEELRKGL